VATIHRLYRAGLKKPRLREHISRIAVHELGTPASPFVYANFVCSLDGRIALHDPITGASACRKA
jgi:hypothetical protein